MEFMLAMLTALLVAWLASLAVARLGYPAMLGELLAGILLGPPLLGLLPAHEGLKYLADVGIFVMMLYIGAEIDPRDLLRASKSALLAAVGGFVVPFAAGVVLTYWYLRGAMPVPAGELAGPYEMKWICGSLFVGLAVGVTSLAAKSRILLDLKLLDTRIAMVMMAGALMADSAALVLFAGISGFADSQTVALGPLLVVALKAVAFFALAIVIGLYVFPRIGRLLARLHSNGRTATFTTLLLLALGFGELAHLFGLHNILGAFMAGLFLRHCLPDRQQCLAMTEQVHDLALGFLAPIFFVTAGYAFSFSVFTTDLTLLVGVVLVAIVGKIAGTVLFYLPSGCGWREGVTIGCGMNGRGAIEIIIAGIGLERGLIDQSLFSVLVFTAIFTTATVPVSLKVCAQWLERRHELVRIRQRHGLLIMGAGPLARLLAKPLAAAQPVALVDRNKANCQAAEADGLTVFVGNGLDEDLLDRAGALEAQTVVGMTANVEVNLLAVDFAGKQFLVPRQMVLLSRDEWQQYEALLARRQVHPLFAGPIDIAAWDRWLALGRTQQETVKLTADADIETLRRRLSNETCLPLVMYRDDAPAIVDMAALQPGDRVVLLRPLVDESVVSDRFDALLTKCQIRDVAAMPLADLFAQVAALLAGTLGLSSETLVQQLWSREYQGGTVIGKGLAVPHLIVEGEGRVEMVVLRCRDGLVFGPDEDTVNAVFVLMTSRDERNFHLRMLSAIAQIAQARDFEARWQQAADTEAIRQLLLTAERRRV